MVRHRQKVCPSFAQVSVDETAINLLPEGGNNQGEAEAEAESDAEASDENGDDAHHAAHSDGVDSHHAASHYNRPQETLNENEIIIGISEENWPKPLRLLEAWSASMQKLEGRSSQIR